MMTRSKTKQQIGTNMKLNVLVGPSGIDSLLNGIIVIMQLLKVGENGL